MVREIAQLCMASGTSQDVGPSGAAAGIRALPLRAGAWDRTPAMPWGHRPAHMASRAERGVW